MEGDTDEDKFSFIQLAAVTANVVQWLLERDHEHQNENGGGDGKTDKSDEQKPESHRRYVDQRLIE